VKDYVSEASWFTLYKEFPDRLEYRTRKNGCVGFKITGELDVAKARELEYDFDKTSNVRAFVEKVYEWTHLTIIIN